MKHYTDNACNGSNCVLKRYFHNILESVNVCDLFGKRGLFRGNYVKDHEMRSSWIIHVGPNPMTSVLI